jgi:hypothetical protein
MKMRAILGALVMAVAVPGCASRNDDGAADHAALSFGLSVRTVGSESTFRALSMEWGGFGQAGRFMRFVIDARDPENKEVYFVNANYTEDGEVPDAARSHYPFAVAVLGVEEEAWDFYAEACFTNEKTFHTGSIQTYELGNGQPPLYAFQYWPADYGHEETIVETAAALRRAFRIPGARMAFVAGGPQQTFDNVKGELADLGFEALTLDEAMALADYAALTPGEAWGTLRLSAADAEQLAPTDIAVFDTPPDHPPMVAGTITQGPQNAVSPTNLAAHSRGTPNMVLRHAQATLAAYADKPVHLRVGSDGYVIEPTSAEIVEQKFREGRDRAWTSLPAVTPADPLPLGEMCPRLSTSCLNQATRFGADAARLGFLANKKVLGYASDPDSESANRGYDMVPQGFAVPLSFYGDFVAANGSLQAKLSDIAARERTGVVSPAERTAVARELRDLFLAAELPVAQRDAIATQVGALGQRANAGMLRVRTSQNADDASPDDDFVVSAAPRENAACRADEAPPTLECAVKAAYASLWSARAIAERSAARFDHATASTGLVVLAAPDDASKIAANGVLATRQVFGQYLGYTLHVQAGDNLVTRPQPGTTPETTFAIFSGGDIDHVLTVGRPASPVANTSMSEDSMREALDLGVKIEQAYCRIKPGYFDGDCDSVWIVGEKSRGLDLDFTRTIGGELLMSGLREH